MEKDEGEEKDWPLHLNSIKKGGELQQQRRHHCHAYQFKTEVATAA